MKICPDCQKEVPDYSTKCKYCDFHFEKGEAQPENQEVSENIKTKRTATPITFAVISVLVVAAILFALLRTGDNKKSEPLTSPFQGLGEPIEVWEQSHQKDNNSDAMNLLYDNNLYYLMKYDGKINHLEITWGDDSALAFEDAKAIATRFIPSDSVLEETYTPREYRIVERYSSATLAPIFDDLAWLGSPAGEFIVIYRQFDFGVSSVVLALGNNP